MRLPHKCHRYVKIEIFHYMIEIGDFNDTAVSTIKKNNSNDYKPIGLIQNDHSKWLKYHESIEIIQTAPIIQNKPKIVQKESQIFH